MHLLISYRQMKAAGAQSLVCLSWPPLSLPVHEGAPDQPHNVKSQKSEEELDISGMSTTGCTGLLQLAMLSSRRIYSRSRAGPSGQVWSCRGHEKGECAASECTLLCNDFQRLGYSRVVVDPSVRLAYNHRDALDVRKEQFVRGIRLTDWADVQSAPPIDWSLTPRRPYSK